MMGCLDCVVATSKTFYRICVCVRTNDAYVNHGRVGGYWPYWRAHVPAKTQNKRSASGLAAPELLFIYMVFFVSVRMSTSRRRRLIKRRPAGACWRYCSLNAGLIRGSRKHMHIRVYTVSCSKKLNNPKTQSQMSLFAEAVVTIAYKKRSNKTYKRARNKSETAKTEFVNSSR